MVKDSLTNAGNAVWSLGWEDPLEEEMATHPSTYVCEILLAEEPGGLYIVRGVAESDVI